MIRSRIAAPRARFTLAVLVLFASAVAARAQTDTANPAGQQPELTQTIFLNNAISQRELNDMQTALRNMLPRAHVYSVATQSAITIRAAAEEQAEAQKLISELDRAQKPYRLTYTFTETDDGKPGGTQHVSLIVLPGSRTVLKQGTRVPILTGGAEQDAKSQVQYIDIGLNIEASLLGTSDSLRLETNIEQSSISEEKPAATQDPIIRQTRLDGSTQLVPGKPLVLGALDLPGSTHHIEVAVVAEPVR